MDFATVRKMVLDRRPVLKQIIDQHGSGSFLAYVKKRGVSTSAVSTARQAELLTIFSDEATRLFGAEVALRATKQLTSDYYVSTAEHHAPVCHPYVASGTVLQSLVANERGDAVVIVFSCSTISLNNSNFPSGVMYHDAFLEEKRLRLLPWKRRHQSVFAAASYTREDFDRVRAEPGYPSLLNTIYGTEAVLGATSFSDQISLTNYVFWKKMPTGIATDLIYIPQETIVNKLLLRYHLQEKTIIHELLFNQVWQESFLKHFDGLTGSFSQSLRKGSFLFWGLHDGVRVQLHYRSGCLISDDGALSYELSPESIRYALEHNLLMPSLALSYIVLSFYYGLTLGGGSGQVSYLSDLRFAYRTLLNTMIGEEAEKFLDGLETSYLSSDFAFISLSLGSRQTLATSLDLLLYGSEEAVARIRHVAETLPLSSALDNLMPELYAFAHGGKQPVLTSEGPEPLPRSVLVPMSLVRQ